MQSSNILSSEKNHLILQELAIAHRQLVLELIGYFQALAKESKTRYKERLEDFASIIQMLSSSVSQNTCAKLSDSIKKFSQGHVSTRYAGLLTRMQREIEKHGQDFFAFYCVLSDWKKIELPQESFTTSYFSASFFFKSVDEAHQHAIDTLRNELPPVDAALSAVSFDAIKRQKEFIDKITMLFFNKIDEYLKTSSNDIDKHKEAIEKAGPQEEDGMLQYALRLGTSYVVAMFLSRVRNLPLSAQKSVLLEQLKCDILELSTDAIDADDMHGYVRGMYLHLQMAHEKNSALAADQWVSKGTVSHLLEEQMKLLDDYYADDVALAKGFYSTNLQDFKRG